MNVEAGWKESSRYQNVIRKVLPRRTEFKPFTGKGGVGNNVEGVGRRKLSTFFSLKSSSMTKAVNQRLEVCFQENVEIWGTPLDAKDEASS
jgi:hypothetical protein